MPTIRWSCNGKEIQADNRNIFTVYEDGIVILKIINGDKEGLYVCEATNGIGSAQTRSFVHIYSAEVLLTTAMELKDTMESAEAVVLSVSTSKFCSTADVNGKNETIDQDQEGKKLKKEFGEEEITTDQYIPTGTLNYLIEAEAMTIRVMSYKLCAYAKVKAKSKKMKEEELFKIIIEEDVVRTRTYLRVVERSARPLWTFQGHTTERPSYWSREVINERTEFEKIFQNDELHEFLEDKDIIERYVQLLKTTETSESSEEHETRFKLRQIGGSQETLEKRKLEIYEEQTGTLAEDTGVFTVVHCVANAMHHVVEAYVILITRYRYKATFDIRAALYQTIAIDNEFEASIEDSVKRQKYFQHSILRGPHFIQPLTIFEEGFNTGLRCSVYGLPIPHIRISHNGCPILRNNSVAGRAITECFIRVEEEWNEKQHRKIRRIRIENASKTTESTERSSQNNETVQTSTTQYEYEQSKQISEAMESVENIEETLTEHHMQSQQLLVENMGKIKGSKTEICKEINKEVFIKRNRTVSSIYVSVIENIHDLTEPKILETSEQEINKLIDAAKPSINNHEEILYATAQHEIAYHDTFLPKEMNEKVGQVEERDKKDKLIDASNMNLSSQSVSASITLKNEVKMEQSPDETAVEAKKEIVEEKTEIAVTDIKKQVATTGIELRLEKLLEHSAIAERAAEELREMEMNLDFEKKLQHETAGVSVVSVTSGSIQASTPLAKATKMQKPTEEELREMETNLDLHKHLEHETVDVSVFSTTSGSAQASECLAKTTNMDQPIDEAIEEVAKRVEERAVEELRQIEINLDLEKHLQQEILDVSVFSIISESTQASVCLAKLTKTEQTAQEELRETKTNLDFEKYQEQETVDISVISIVLESTEASVRLAKEIKREQPTEVMEEVARSEKEIVKENVERAVEQLREMEKNLNLGKHSEKETINVSVFSIASETAQASICLEKAAKIEQLIEVIEAEKQEKEDLQRAAMVFTRIETNLNLGKHLEHETVEVSVLILASKSAQASIPLAKQGEKQTLDIVEEVAKPEREEKLEKDFEELKETGITFNLEKNLEC
ncbi:unnamed protein product, partial [Brugia timori]|uniref:Ig-like domain-containing protein n=1 Tax=Brugia timori TaxID=42155 RepID=A0A0R3R1D2_9BILA